MKLPFKWTILVAMLSAAVALTGCEKSPPTPLVTFRIGTFQTPDYLPHFVMQEKGFDKKNGLSLMERSFTGGAAAIDAMTANTLDMSAAIGTMPLLVASKRGLILDKAVPVAANNLADREHPGAGVVIGHSVYSRQDLEGRKIASNARNRIAGAALEARLKHAGIRSYSFADIHFPNLGLAVARGNVAAAAMAEPYLTQSILRGDGKLLDWIVGGPPLERAAYIGIVFIRELRRRNPDGVKAFLRAHLAAVRWIKEHLEEVRLVLAKRMHLGEDVARKIKVLRWPLDATATPPCSTKHGNYLFAPFCCHRWSMRAASKTRPCSRRC